jgi:hypothetical protein
MLDKVASEKAENAAAAAPPVPLSAPVCATAREQSASTASSEGKPTSVVGETRIENSERVMSLDSPPPPIRKGYETSRSAAKGLTRSAHVKPFFRAIASAPSLEEQRRIGRHLCLNLFSRLILKRSEGATDIFLPYSYFVVYIFISFIRGGMVSLLFQKNS